MDCASCRKTVKKITAVKCIPCNKCFHPSCIGRHKVINEIGHLVPCTGQSVELAATPTSPSTDVFVDASSAGVLDSATATDVPTTIPPTTTSTSTTTTITTTSTTTVTITGTSSLAAARPSYRTVPSVVSTLVSPAPTTELSQLCANVRALVQSQNDIKTTLQSHTLKFNQFTEFIQTQKAHNLCMENAITSLTAEINGKLQALTENQLEVTSRVNNLEASIASLRLQVNEMQSPSATGNTVTSPGDLETLKERLRAVESKQRTYSLTISGLPSVEGRSDLDAIIQLMRHLKVAITPSDVLELNRFKPAADSSNPRPPMIFVRLRTSGLRNAILAARRTAGQLTAASLDPSLGNNKIYINEFLPPETYRLLVATRVAAKARGFKYVWCRDNVIKVRKDSGAQVIIIDNLGEIETKLT